MFFQNIVSRSYLEWQWIKGLDRDWEKAYPPLHGGAFNAEKPCIAMEKELESICFPGQSDVRLGSASSATIDMILITANVCTLGKKKSADATKPGYTIGRSGILCNIFATAKVGIAV